MDFSAQASLHGTPWLSGPKNSLFNAVEDAMQFPDLSLVYIDTADGRHHISGPDIRSLASTPQYAAYKQALLARGRTRD